VLLRKPKESHERAAEKPEMLGEVISRTQYRITELILTHMLCAAVWRNKE